MSDAVNQTGAVESLLIHYLFEILPDSVLVVPVENVGLYILQHVLCPEVRAAVAEALQRGDSRRDSRIGVCAGGGDDVGGEGRVVAAAVLGVDNERDIENIGFKRGELPVGAQHIKDILGGGVFGLRVAYEKALMQLEVFVGAVSVHGNEGHFGYYLYRLAQDVLGGDILRILVVGIKREYAFLERVHNV